jgi:hypothetical protein
MIHPQKQVLVLTAYGINIPKVTQFYSSFASNDLHVSVGFTSESTERISRKFGTAIIYPRNCWANLILVHTCETQPMLYKNLKYRPNVTDFYHKRFIVEKMEHGRLYEI